MSEAKPMEEVDITLRVAEATELRKMMVKLREELGGRKTMIKGLTLEEAFHRLEMSRSVIDQVNIALGEDATPDA